MDGEGAPAADGTRSSGVVRERSIRDLEGIAEDLSTAGWSVVEGILGADTVSVACDRLDAIFDSEADVAAERGWLTDTYRVSYALAAKDRLFVDLCTDPRVLEVVRAVLGSDARVAGCNGFDLLPGGPAQDLHRDHPDPTPGSTLYLHVVVALDAFTEANGATRVVPASHSRTDLRGESPRDGQSAQGRGSDGPRPRDTTPRDAEVVSVEVPVGGAVAFDGALVHGAGANRSFGRRRALHLFYCRSWVRPHWDWPATFTAEQAAELSDGQRGLFGFGDGSRRYDQVSRRVDR